MTKTIPFGQVMQDRMGGEVDQVAAIDEGNDFYPLRQDLIVQLHDLLVDALQDRLRIGTLLQHCDTRDDIIVIDDLPVLAVILPGQIGPALFSGPGSPRQCL